MSAFATTWPTTNVGSLCDQIRGVSYAKDDARDRPSAGLVPILRATNILDDGVLAFDDLVYVPPTVVAETQYIRKHDIVLAASSGSLSVVGKAAQSKADWQGGFGAFCKVLRPNKRVEPRYLAYFFRTAHYRQRISQLAAGANINNLRNEHLDDLEIPLPPLPEQKRIADILDKADAIRRKRGEAVALLSKATSSLFFQEFGDPLFNPKEWDVVLLADVCHKITDGVHLKPQYREMGVPFVSVKDITTGKLRFDNVKYVSEEDHRVHIKACHPEFGDVLLTKVGATYGRPALVDTDRPFSLYVSVALLKPNRTLLDPVFLKEVLASEELKRQADRSIKGAGVPDLHLVEIRKFRIPLPPLHVQQAFVAKTKAIHALEDKLQSAANEKTDLFKSLVQRAFRGDL